MSVRKNPNLRWLAHVGAPEAGQGSLQYRQLFLALIAFFLLERLRVDLGLRILSVSYDEPLRRTRHMMLEAEDYDVTSCACLEEALKACSEGAFNLFILGHSIPTSDKHRLIETFRRYSPSIIISLIRHSGDDFVVGADYHLQTEPEPLLRLIAEILRGKRRAHHSGSQN